MDGHVPAWSSTPPPRPGRYSAVRPLLADLEQETRAALRTLYGFSETEARARREAEPRRAAWDSTQPRFLNRIPLMAFREGDRGQATDFLTGRKRKVGGSIIHKAADVVHVHESKEVVGFQLVSAQARGAGPKGAGLGRRAGQGRAGRMGGRGAGREGAGPAMLILFRVVSPPRSCRRTHPQLG